ncbi:hypothetical protein [Coleofasciculus sp. E2-BRE-01]|uniref:hypothetical protein n=1 Tax=Coleofasciculus sp. E2-BRE-01 TaxID=3069524 RepID=UPI0032FB2125
MKLSTQLRSERSKNFSKSQRHHFWIKSYRWFNLVFFIAALTPLISVGLFNMIIDPYDIFNTPDFLGINDSKPHKDKNDRLFKATDVIRIKPVTVFLGSSRTKQALNPSHSALKNEQPAYNLAINGPNAYEVRRYLEHAIANQKNIKTVVFGVDFSMFNSSLMNQPTFSEKRLEKSSLALEDFLNSTFSLDALFASRETVVASLADAKENDNYGDNGFMPNRKLAPDETEWRFNGGIELYFDFHSDYQFSEQYFSDLKKIVELCEEYGVDLKVFISPSHATQWEAIRATGRWQTFEQWKRKLVKIVPVWDFSGYNSITTEVINDTMQNYADNSHYTEKVGNLVLNRIFSHNENTVTKDFGILITPQNIESHLNKINEDRELWAEENPDEVRLVLDINRKMKQKEIQ